MVAAKICGLKTAESIAAAVEYRADFIGFNFFRKSPRFVEPAQAGALGRAVPGSVLKTGLLVDDDDARIASILGSCPLDLLQLHGSETPERVTAIRAKFGLPVMKVIKVRDAADIARAADYEAVADRLLFDAQPPAEMKNPLPGGNAVSFDWTLLQGFRSRLPWMLSGGLTAGNLAEAVRQSGAPAVDVASGVEDRPGEKNLSKIKDFLEAARSL
ncbi:phosphoribosylanthranilate isomerase [Dongia sedimenti]|uniref:N-(5'-phosphoribosyl)anthranilate isomerase n=1 Tax=Dongia sedimenti TaxID=3064282 RepID=A0ABU0YML6_9PROT|nr:phosphoribosylanthranilate isomerase [Rhodospirillaceae bacterium R-7]